MYNAKIVQELEDDKKLILKNLIDSIVLRMPDMDASDIDMGSTGCRGKIWYRIQGAKNPDPEAGEWDEFEMDFLLLNIIMEKQRDFLMKERNVDFSYTIPYKEDITDIIEKNSSNPIHLLKNLGDFVHSLSEACYTRN